MWIGSKVPPRMPVRTTPRIGRGWSHQPKGTGDVGGPATESGTGIDIAAPDPGRQMDPRHPMRGSGQSDDLTLADVLA